jgi:hypothetical protein
MPLLWVTSHASMGCHITKTTIEIADDLFERAQRVAREEKTIVTRWMAFRSACAELGPAKVRSSASKPIGTGGIVNQ